MTLHELFSFRVGREPGCEGTGSNWSPEVSLSVVAFGDVRKLKGYGTHLSSLSGLQGISMPLFIQPPNRLPIGTRIFTER